MNKQSTISLVTLGASIISLIVATTMFVENRILSANQPRPGKKRISISTTPTTQNKLTTPAIGIDPLDRLAVKFSTVIQGMEPINECLPVVVEAKSHYSLEYLFCSDKALEEDGESKQLTANFEVTEPLARKYNFWRRIYSHFSSRQHLLHLADYPEVVLEIYDLSNQPPLSYHAQRKFIADISKSQKNYYRRLFKQLHQYRTIDEKFYSPDMLRISRLMAHIEDDNKYLVAANSMRTQTGQRDYVANGFAQAFRYLSEIETEFDRQGIPRELARLAFVESSFNLNARSKVGASGVYQIMQSTGKQYLKITDGIDERNDPIKAARAASKLLKMNYNLTQSWPLAITAYNHGVGSVKRAVRTTGSSKIEVIIEKYDDKNFGFASKNFYTEFLAMIGTLQDAHKLFPAAERGTPIAYEVVRLPAAIDIAKVRQKYRVTNSQIADLNPDIFLSHIRKNGTLPKGYSLKIPVAKPAVSAIYSPMKPRA